MVDCPRSQSEAITEYTSINSNTSITGINNSSVTLAGLVRMAKLDLYDISSIELDQTVGVSDFKVEYGHPVIVMSRSQEGKMIVETKESF